MKLLKRRKSRKACWNWRTFCLPLVVLKEKEKNWTNETIRYMCTLYRYPLRTPHCSFSNFFFVFFLSFLGMLSTSVGEPPVEREWKIFIGPARLSGRAYIRPKPSSHPSSPPYTFFFLGGKPIILCCVYNPPCATYPPLSFMGAVVVEKGNYGETKRLFFFFFGVCTKFIPMFTVLWHLKKKKKKVIFFLFSIILAQVTQTRFAPAVSLFRCWPDEVAPAAAGV